MDYRGKHFTIVQGIGPDSWKWRVDLNEKSAKGGEAPSRAAAMNNVVWAVNMALKAQKLKPTSPEK
jgi:hypothetical protein